MTGGAWRGGYRACWSATKRLPSRAPHHVVMPRKSAAELKKQRRADRWGVGSADTPPVEGAPTPSELTNQWVEAHYNDKAPDGVAWGAHVKQWRSDGAKDTHISAIIAATTFT